MTRRLVIAILCVVAAVAFAAASSDETSKGRVYTVELDNAFGMVVDGDVRVQGTNAGKVKSIELDERTKKALIEIEITEDGFGSFRTDAHCETRPQSPLGEYFMDCRPGTGPTELEDGGRVRVEQTSSTIPPDLITNIMRRPFRERMRLILSELGAGLAGRPADLNAAIRRAVPALRQSSRLLKILADHNKVIRDLVRDADRVITTLADNKEDVGRFVVEARDTAEASAARANDIATNFNRLPTFLTELTPTMAALERTSREQRPVFEDLSAAAPQLRRFLDLSAEFSEAQRPALRALGDTAPVGRQAVRSLRPRIQELRDYAKPAPDLTKNLAITLEDFDDRDRAVEAHALSPGGKGFTGTEALLQYVLIQAVQSNAFDELGHLARVSLVQSKCAPYQNAETYKANEELLKDCRAWLGPNQPGITTPDPTAGEGGTPGQTTSPRTAAGVTPDKGPAGSAARASGDGGGSDGVLDGRSASEIEQIAAGLLEQLGGVGGGGASQASDPYQLLDYLLAP
jgi:virulence factor Mce-like protein